MKHGNYESIYWVEWAEDGNIVRATIGKRSLKRFLQKLEREGATNIHWSLN